MKYENRYQILDILTKIDEIEITEKLKNGFKGHIQVLENKYSFYCSSKINIIFDYNKELSDNLKEIIKSKIKETLYGS